jgi:mRNA-degrading endonuclease HigB of HigAB toxin-antitoxin module
MAMSNYSQKFISYTSDDEEITSTTLEAGDTQVVKAHIKEWNSDTSAYVYTTPESISAVVEKYENDEFTTISNASVFEMESTGIYKVVFTVPYTPGIYYLKLIMEKDSFTDINRLKLRVKIDV